MSVFHPHMDEIRENVYFVPDRLHRFATLPLGHLLDGWFYEGWHWEAVRDNRDMGIRIRRWRRLDSRGMDDLRVEVTKRSCRR